jgi:hypothetical protein
MSARPWQDSQTVDQVLINADLEQEAARARVADEPLARLWQAARWLIYDSDIHASEIACALGALVWVVVLALRPHLFDTNQNYNALAAITHESYVMATALGLLGLNAAGLVAYALSLDDLAVVRVRRVAILLYGGFFFAGFAAIAAATGLGITMGFQLIAAIIAAWGFWRLGRQERQLARKA